MSEAPALLFALLFGVVSSLVASLLFPTVETIVLTVLARTFGWARIRRGVDVTGKWNVEWHVESRRFSPIEIDPSVEVRQFSKWIVANFKARELDCDLVGTIESGRYITGTWRDTTTGGYHGAFQLIIDLRTRAMKGIWIGFSSEGHMKSGDFNWERARKIQPNLPLRG